jgi:hypothetical protein
MARIFWLCEHAMPENKSMKEVQRILAEKHVACGLFFSCAEVFLWMETKFFTSKLLEACEIPGT